MHIRTSLIALGALALAGAAWLSPAEAAPPRVHPQSCAKLAATIGPGKIWHAAFWGRRLDDFDRPIQTYLTPCFSTKSSCTAWLYWAQSDWQQSHVLTRCKRG